MAKKRLNGEGSIFLEKNGKWRAQASIKGRRVSQTFRTQAQAKNWLHEIRNAADKGLTASGLQLTVEMYLKGWLKKKLPHMKDNGAVSYQMYVEDDIIPALGHIKLRNLDGPTIEEFYDCLDDQEVGARTQKYIHQVLSSALGDALKERQIVVNPMDNVEAPEYDPGEMLILTEDETKRLLRAAKGSLLGPLWDLAVKYGIRKAELFGLRWTDISWSQRTVTIQRQVHRIRGKGVRYSTPKTTSSRRTIPLGSHTLDLLAEHQKRQQERIAYLKGRVEAAEAQGKVYKKSWKENGLIFPSTVGTPLEKGNFGKIHHALLEKAGIDCVRMDPVENKERRLRFHDLRHTAASMMIAGGFSVLVISRILGHSKVSTTLDIYGHMMTDAQKQVTDYMDDLLNPDKKSKMAWDKIDNL